MTDTTVLEASERAKAGKGAARATRRAGLVPAVIYGAKRPAVMVALDPRLIVREMHKPGFRSHIYNVRAGRVNERALIRDIQLHPVSDQPLHVDFHRIAVGEDVRVAIAVHFTGEDDCVGLKRGGVLNVVHHSLEVTVDPDRIPEFVTGDISGLEIGDAIRWSDLAGIENLTLATGDEADVVVATIAPPTILVEPELEPEEVAADAVPAIEQDGAPTEG